MRQGNQADKISERAIQSCPIACAREEDHDEGVGCLWMNLINDVGPAQLELPTDGGKAEKRARLVDFYRVALAFQPGRESVVMKARMHVSD